MDNVEFVGKVVRIDVDKIRPYREQPRKHFDQQDLEALQASMEKNGNLMPVIVRALPAGLVHTHELIDGERRWRAARRDGQKTIKVWVVEVADEKTQFEMAVTVNFARTGHTVREEVEAVRRLSRDGNSVPRIAALCNRSGAWVYQRLSLGYLPPKVLALLEPSNGTGGQLAIPEALALCKLPKADQFPTARDIVTQCLPSKQAMRLIRQRIGGIQSREATASDDLATMVRAVKQIQSCVGRILALPQSRFSEALIHGCDPARVRKIIKDLKASRGDIDEFLASVQRAEEKIGA